MGTDRSFYKFVTSIFFFCIVILLLKFATLYQCLLVQVARFPLSKVSGSSLVNRKIDAERAFSLIWVHWLDSD